MKEARKILFRSVSIVLAVLLCVSLVPFSALAAETGKAPTAANGPGKDHSYIAVSDETAKAPGADYSDGFAYAYTNKYGANKLFSGAVSYDLSSNTLTLKNFGDKKRFFEICNMCDDFKVKLSGVNTISSLSAFGYEGECSMTITGDGTLNVLDYGIELFGNKSRAVLTIGNEATVNASYNNGKAISVSGSTAAAPLVLKGKESHGGKAGRIRMEKAEIPWNYNKEIKSAYSVYYNPNKPYSFHSDFADTVYFGINEPILRSGVTRRNDNLEHDCLQFTIMALYAEDDGSFVIQTTLTQTYVWDDDPNYESFKENYKNITYDMIDPEYQLVDTSHLTDEWAVVDSGNNAMSKVNIVPSDAVIDQLPEILTASLPSGVTNRNYSAQLEAKPANEGSITSYKLSGSAAEWLSVDSSGLLSGKPAKSGNYTAVISAVETNGSKSWESASISLRIKISDPNNRVVISNAVKDKFFHKLVVRKTSDNSVVKTINLKNRNIVKNSEFLLGELPAGEYEVELCGEVTGGTVAYKDSKAKFTVEENSVNVITIAPGDADVTPDEKSLMICVPEYENLKAIDYYNIRFEFTNGTVINRAFKYNEGGGVNILDKILEDDRTLKSVSIYTNDAFQDEIDLISGKPEINGNIITLHTDASDIVRYTVTGFPEEVKCINLAKRGSGYKKVLYSVFENNRFIFKKITDKKFFSVAGISFFNLGTGNYYTKAADVTVSGDKINVSFSKLKKDVMLSGKITDGDGKPIEGAAVTISSQYTYPSSGFTTVTDKNGEYSADIYSNVSIRIDASASGYETVKPEIIDVAKENVTADFSLKRSKSIAVKIIGGAVRNARFILEGESFEKDLYKYSTGLNGDNFNLPLTDGGDYDLEISMVSDDTVGTTKAKVSVKNGFGEAELNPVRKGVISWRELDENELPVNDYTGLYFRINGKTYIAGSTYSAEVDPGSYTVELYKNIWDANPVASQTLTVKSGETVYFNQKLPDGTMAEDAISASFTAPEKAMTDEQYRVTGVINSIDNKYITGLSFNCSTTNGNVKTGQGVQYVTVNGTRVKLSDNKVLRSENPETDWSLPLNVTLYCKQNAISKDSGQSVFVYAKTSADKDDSSADFSKAPRAGIVTTRYSPSISLNIAEEIGGSAVTDEDGNTLYVPNPVCFFGKVGNKDGIEVKLYDNGVLCAVAKTVNGQGVYQGDFKFSDDSTLHEIRAEAEIDGETAVATASCAYTPGKATLNSVYMGFETDDWNSLSISRIPLKGQTSYSYRVATSSKFSFFAIFDNDEMLDDLTYQIDGKEVTAKVFFRLTATDNQKYTVPAYKEENRYKTELKNFDGKLLTGVKVLYMSKDKDSATKVTYDGEEYEVSQALKRINVKDTDNGNYVSDKDYLQWMKNICKEYKQSKSDDKDKTPTGKEEESKDKPADEKDDEEDNEPITANEAHEAMVWVLNQGSGSGPFKAVNAEQATAKAPKDKFIQRTYNDSQPWTYTKQNFKLRSQELGYKGYVCSTYTDETTGHQMFLFTGTFYYDHYGMPVPSLQIQKVYSGILKTEDDPRMFRKANTDKGGDCKGEMLGSQLDVTYTFDATAHKWYRFQTATISPDAHSPIHTAASQIPCKTDAPYSYSPANVHLIGSTGADGKSKASTGADAKASTGDGNTWSGIEIGIDVGKVTGKTWTSGAISIGGAVYGKFASNTFVTGTKNVPRNAPFDLKKWNWKTNKGAFNELDVIDESLMRYAKGSKSIYTVGLTRESLGGAATTFTLSKINDATGKSNGSANDGLDYLEKQLRDNMRYWGNVKSVANSTKDNSNGWLGNYSTDEYTADTMIRKTREVADKLTAIQKAVEDAQTQDTFTKNCTNALGYASAITSLIPEYGTVCALTLDSVSFLLSAANDTRNAKVQQAVKEFIQAYGEYLEEDKKEKEYIENDENIIKDHKKMGANVKTRKEVAAGMGKSLEDPIDSGGSTGGSTDSDVTMYPLMDPSGIVYEAVLSNPVEGATVTLHNYENADNPFNVWDDSYYLNQDNPLRSDSAGYYNWDVPEGEWYVTAEKDGYEPGSSNADKEATVTHGDYNYLPVMPPQLDVNIPLVSYAAPEIDSVLARTDGIYITFSKYMDESTLTKDNFKLTDYDGNSIGFTVEKLDSEKAPNNIKYDGATPSYTKTVKLAAKLSADDEVTLKVESGVKSYAGVNPAAPYGEILTVEKKPVLKAPEFSVKSGKVDYGEKLRLTAEEGATIIYTTDGSAPSESNGIKAKGSADISLLQDTTVLAIAVSPGSTTSETAKAEYTIKTRSAEHEPTGADDPTPTAKTPKLSKTKASLKAGGALTLKVSNGKVKSWKTSKKAVASVKNGKVTALKKGSAKITAVLTTGKKLTCKLTVKTSPTIKIGKKKFNKKTTYSVSKGKKLIVAITGKAASVKNKYKSSSKKIARITSKANAKKVTIKALKKGKTTITLTVNGVSFRIKVKVKK